MEKFGLKEERVLEEGGQEQKRNEDVLSPTHERPQTEKSDGPWIQTKCQSGRVEATKLSKMHLHFFFFIRLPENALLEKIDKKGGGPSSFNVNRKC